MILLVGVTVSFHRVAAQTGTSLSGLLGTAGAVKIEALKTDTFFSEKYVISIEQPLDHAAPDPGSFMQRVIICHRGFDRPVVFITEGYDAGYAVNPGFIDELAYMLEANIICAEHRFFGESVPDTLDWHYLTVANAAGDHHRIVESMKKIYPGKWLSTGISKGGQTALYHRAFYPDDVNATVGYVCPLNFSTEDLRVYDFLDHVGDSACRSKVHRFQVALLMRKKECLPEFRKMAEKEHQEYKGGFEWGYELTVMEYSFAFWQWGVSCDDIPAPDAPAKKMIEHLDAVAGLDWISVSGIAGMQPFFYQSLAETGMYGYDLDDFPGLITSLTTGRFDFSCPEGVQCVYDPAPMRRVDDFARHEATHMIFVYGEWDPWSATAVQWSGNPGVRIFYREKGSHGSRIWNLDEKQRDEISALLQDWMGTKVRPLKMK